MALDAEYLRMENDWFFKWHYIGGDSVVEIDGFDGRMIKFGGVKFFGTARDVYWDTIQRYARQKVGHLFDELEVELQKYPLEIRSNALNEAQSLIRVFVGTIRKAAVDKDRILRGNGVKFPPQQDLGNWAGARPLDVEARIATLRHIYCDMEVAKGGDGMVFSNMMRDKVTLVKADGTVVRENIQAQVSTGRIITFDADLPLEPADHYLRSLPSGLVEDYVVDDPNFMTGIQGIPSSFQSKVHRSTEAAAQAQQVVQRITNNFHGSNSRVTFGTDNSINVVNQLRPMEVASLVEQIKPHLDSLPEPQRTEIAAPLRLLEDEIKSGSPEPSTVQGALRSIQTVLEGAAGNLIAAGILALISKML
ncbi:hypothetical protein [Shumkonia mesophila]|uniref:hypothetical protein n=1 Tax=Shumkonia mesophila TaxID=2838854 RepID=UPI0029345034|nr:hypothetical protein [Shumkonia mesophila]